MMILGKTTYSVLLGFSSFNTTSDSLSFIFPGGTNLTYSAPNVLKVYFNEYPRTPIDYGGLPKGIEQNTIYYLKFGTYTRVHLTLSDAISDINHFDFTPINMTGFERGYITALTYKYTTFPCIERASTNVEDMFCCPPQPAINTNIPEYLNLDTGSEDDSGDYYLATYPAMFSIAPLNPPTGNLAGTPANLAYKSRNKPFVPITRVQSNIYQGPSLYGTFAETYTLAWEIMTDHEVVAGLATGNIRIKVLCTIWSYGRDNGQGTLGLKTIQEYYSDWQDKAVFNYTGTCTILNNMDVDFMFPSVAGYYSTPAGLPIPHTVSVSKSATNVTMPSTLFLNMPDAVFVTPEGDIPLGNIAETLNYDSILGAYYSDIKNHYLIKGRYYLPFSFYPLAASANPFNPNRMGIGFGGGIDSQISEIGGGLYYDTMTNQGPYYFGAGHTPPLYFTNDIEEKGPFVGSLSGTGAGFGGLFSGLAHGKPFIDSRAKAIYTATAAGNPIFDLEGHVIGVSLVGGAGAGYITPPTVAISNSNAICVATLGTGARAGMVDFVTVTNSATNFGDRVNSRAFFSAPPPPYFNLTEKNRKMDLFYSQYESARKRQTIGTSFQPYNFYKNYFYYITSSHPDAYITSLTPPPPS